MRSITCDANHMATMTWVRTRCDTSGALFPQSRCLCFLAQVCSVGYSTRPKPITAPNRCSQAVRQTVLSVFEDTLTLSSSDFQSQRLDHKSTVLCHLLCRATCCLAVASQAWGDWAAYGARSITERNAFSSTSGSFLPRRSARRRIPAQAFSDR